MNGSRTATLVGAVVLSSLLGCSGEGEAPKQERTFVVEYKATKTRVPAKPKTFELSPLELAIWSVESNQQVGAILGDHGNARGPLQIWRACWIDATEFDPSIGGVYEDVDDLKYAVRIFRAYSARYAVERRIGRPVTDEDRAKIWNGGPNGFRKTGNVDRYWAKVQARMQEGG